jgi:putative spermidine/putrescine transport system ATP-binding protein
MTATDHMTATARLRSAPGERPTLVLRGLTKQFGDFAAVDGVDLEVRRGEFVTLLGPSGSGKTTTLRMIAGFTHQSGGTIEIEGTDMRGVPPYRRDVGMIFQNYALFPHMTAAANVAFPLEMRHVPRSEIKRRVDDALALVRLAGFGERYPRQLSGGQQQRVAFARAVVFGPRLLLMDEPLGALDKKLREALQLEIMQMSRQLGATVIYVTHDQEEALTMSDRIAIFSVGKIAQLGSGEDLYDRPASLFVADFIGDSNILRGRFQSNGDAGLLVHGDRRLQVSQAAVQRTGIANDADGALVVRPERIRMTEPGGHPPGSNALAATVTEVLFLGPIRKYVLTLADGQRAVVRAQAGAGERTWHPDDRVSLTWEVDDGVLVADPGR